MIELGQLDDLRERSAAVARRVGLWTNKLKAAFSLGQIFREPIRFDDGTVEEFRYRWKVGPTKEHCTDCSSLNGRVMTASEWRAAGIKPQSPDLACKGWQCLCEFELTDDPSGGAEGL